MSMVKQIKMEVRNYIKLGSFCTTKRMMTRIKRHSSDLERIFYYHLPDNKLYI